MTSEAVRSALSDQFTAHMTVVSVVALAGISLMYQSAVGGAARHWNWGVALLAGSLVHGVVMRRRSQALLVALFRGEGHDRASAKAQAKLQLGKVTLDGVERERP
jgi:hypothetical protein